MEAPKLKRPNSSVEFRVSVIVECSNYVKGKTTHRIAAYKLSDVVKNMEIMFNGYEFSLPRLISRKSDNKDIELQDGDVVMIQSNKIKVE